MSTAGGAEPRRGLAILTCMDARIDPLALLGLALGDAHVVRNAGGIVDEGAVRSLVISQRRLATREVLVLQHTGCGLLGLDDEALAREVEADSGAPPAWAGGGFADLDESVRRSVAALRAEPALPRRDGVRGAVVDLATGTVRDVATRD
ncbi:MAG TPA: carbonic anhydrase [Miltoncostaeaceae bacterium]|nr:carbonic anhydrase [Miltoncostaeaceae bacterium]